MSDRLVVAHAIPRYSHLDSDAAASAESLAWGWNEHAPDGWLLRRNEIQGQPVMHVRNMLVEWALSDVPTAVPPSRVIDDRGPPADIILWQDSDVSFEPADAMKLLRTLADAPLDVAAVGAPCIIQSREGDVRANVNANGFESSMPLIHRGACAEVAQVGFGLIATRTSAYRALGATPHLWRYGPRGTSDPIGEDGGWCDDIRALGFSIFCHGGVRPWHTFPRRFRIGENEHWLTLSGAKPEKG